MASPSNSTVALNPDTYLNHLSPDDARDFEILRNVTLFVFGAFIWDILVYIPDDIHIVRRSPFRFVIFCFVFSRLFSVAFIFLAVLGRTMPNSNPHILTLIATCLSVSAMVCATYLFLRRVHAVYADKRWVRWFFSIFWAIHAASELAAPLGIIPTYIPGTRYTRAPHAQPYVTFVGFVVLLFDTSVFLAISHKIATSHSSLDDSIRWDTLVSGKALPRLSRAILRGGQQYYLITATWTILVTVMVHVPSVRPQTKVAVAVPFPPLVVSMACRVFRNTKLFDFDVASTNPTSNLQFTYNPSSERHFRSDC